LTLPHVRVSNSVLAFDGKYPGGGNVTSTVVLSAKQALVFDSLLYPEDTRELLEGIKGLNLSIEGLINTHWHADHTAGNQSFLESKRIISHSLCPDLMRADNLDWINNELKEEDKIRPTYPNEAIENGTVIHVGDQNEIQIFHMPGHTPDSIIGWLKEENVIIAGDTVMELPFVGYGDSRDLISSLKKVQSISRSRSKIIQGHGAICEIDKLDDDLNYIELVRSRATEYVALGKSVETASAEIKLEDCVTKERFQVLVEGFGSILWCHPENVKRVYSELQPVEE
jgi:cyclase